MEIIKSSYNPKFESFFNDKSFYKILYGSAGSGKSYAVAQKIVKRCLEEKGHRVWAFRKVSTFVEASVFDSLKTVIKSWGLTSMVKVNKTEKTITFPHSDSVIKCSGLDEVEKIKSITELTIAWIEETTEFNEQDINQIDLRMRGLFPYYRELIMTFNPVSELHWLKYKFFDNVLEGVKKNLFTLHTTFENNIFLGEDYKQRLRENHSHDPNNYRVYVLGNWGKITTGMEYYKNFRTDDHVKETNLKHGVPVHITIDFNIHPYMTCSIWQIEKIKEINDNGYGKNVYYAKGLKEIALRHPKNSTEDLCLELLDKYEEYLKQGVVLYGDASGRNKHTASKKTNYNIIDDYLKQYIIENRVPRSNPLSDFRHNFMNRMLFGSLPIVCEINSKMKFLIEDLTHCLEDGEKKKIKTRVRDPISKVIVEKFGHFTDGMDYFFCEAFKDFT